MEFFYLLIGLAILILGAEVIVKPSIKIARFYGISEFVIGLTLLSMSTSIPELTITIVGGLHRLTGLDVSDLVVGDIVGSNIANLVFILGFLGIVSTLKLKNKILIKQSFFLIGSVLLILVLGADRFYSRMDGVVLILFYGMYLFFLGRQINGQIHEKFKSIKKQPKKSINLIKEGLMLIIGSALVIYGARLTITHGATLAEVFQVSPNLIGIFVIGLGTSLPELVVSLSALRGKAVSMSVGNVVGSNIFNILVALGSGAVVSGFHVNQSLIKIDIPFLLMISVIVILFFYSRSRLERKEAILLLCLYFGYVGVKLWGNI